MPDHSEEHQASPTEVGVDSYMLLTDPKQREIIKRRGVDLVNESVDADMLIFLDKSARPLTYLYRKLFPKVLPDNKMPKIKYLNVGTEKMGPLYGYAWHQARQQREQAKDKVWRSGRTDINAVITSIQNKEDLAYFYGAENLDQLLKVLEVNSTPTKRLIVDDVEDSGKTRQLAERIVNSADPVSYYAFFPFLESPEDKEAFKVADVYGRTNRAALPWHGDNGLVEESGKDYYSYQVDPTFVTKRATDSAGRGYSLRILQELGKLADEV